jgi:hypothetical protein
VPIDYSTGEDYQTVSVLRKVTVAECISAPALPASLLVGLDKSIQWGESETTLDLTAILASTTQSRDACGYVNVFTVEVLRNEEADPGADAWLDLKGDDPDESDGTVEQRDTEIAAEDWSPVQNDSLNVVLSFGKCNGPAGSSHTDLVGIDDGNGGVIGSHLAPEHEGSPTCAGDGIVMEFARSWRIKVETYVSYASASINEPQSPRVTATSAPFALTVGVDCAADVIPPMYLVDADTQLPVADDSGAPIVKELTRQRTFRPFLGSDRLCPVSCEYFV